MAIAVFWAFRMPMGGDPGAWHAPWTLVPVAIVIGLAALGCWTAAGGARAFRERLDGAGEGARA